jgi:phosphatidylglycerophosphate synthase
MGFTPEEITAARNYKYNGHDASIAVRLFYRRYWDFMIRFVPSWVAPNLLTFIGFLLEIVSFLLTLYFSGLLRDPLPRWLCALNSVFLFAYQTLDNLDGRQARRTGSSSALGQFFDHGCDAITGLSELIKLTATFRLGAVRSFYVVFLIGFGFFITSWQEYVTDFFYLGPINAPDEGLGAMAICYMLVAIDPSLVRFAESRYWDWTIVGVFVATVLYIGITTVRTALKNPEQKARLVGSAIPGVVTSGITYLLARAHPEDVKNPFFVLSSGYVLQYLSQIIIVTRLTGRPVWRLFHPTLIVMWAAEIAYLLVPSLAAGRWFWKVFLAGVLGIMVVFDVRVATGLAEGLRIRIFSLKKLD